jgi:hypothetical protein
VVVAVAVAVAVLEGPNTAGGFSYVYLSNTKIGLIELFSCRKALLSLLRRGMMLPKVQLRSKTEQFTLLSVANDAVKFVSIVKTIPEDVRCDI